MLAIGVTTPVLGLAAITGAGIPAQAASAVHYVALGDSYSSGVGAGGTSGSCAQSPNAYPALWTKANSPASFTFAACSGARASDVISSQLSSLTASTTLVSITIGGNDSGFSSIMETCVLKSTSSCESAVAAGEKYVNSTLPGQLNTTLADMPSSPGTSSATVPAG
jgi:lysophospholipase L1-like esterase